MGNAADMHNAPGQPGPEQQHGQPVEMPAEPQHAASSHSVPQHASISHSGPQGTTQQQDATQHQDSIRAQDAGPAVLPPSYAAASQKGPGPQGHVPPTGQPVPLGQLRHDGQLIDCPWCLKRAHARMSEDGQSMQIITGVLIGCICICLACLPCCLNWFIERTWTCSECGHKVAMSGEGENNPTIPVTPQNGYGPGPGPQQQQQFHPQQQAQQQQQYDQQNIELQQQQPVQEPPMAHGK